MDFSLEPRQEHFQRRPHGPFGHVPAVGAGLRVADPGVHVDDRLSISARDVAQEADHLDLLIERGVAREDADGDVSRFELT